MNEQITQRFVELVLEGRTLIQQLPYDGDDGDSYWVSSHILPRCQQWISSVTNLINIVTNSSSTYPKECERLLAHDDMRIGIPIPVVKKLLGVIESANNEWEKGLLRNIEYLIAAATFDEFLDHAAVYHKGNKKMESAVLSSSVLEDTVKKICQKNSITTAGKSLEELIDALVAANVLTMVKGKRVKSYSGVRNHALHAEWDEFDISDVGNLIKGLRELIEDYL